MIAALVLFAQLGATLPPAAAPALPAVVTTGRVDTTRAVSFRALVAPDTVYVGQQATYQLGVFVDASVRTRLRRLEARAPEMRGLLAYEPAGPRRPIPLRVGRRRLAVHVYLRPIFPLAPGRVVLAPAQLVYAMPLTFSFFSREESYELRSESTAVVALPLPTVGRPSDFDGAVGRFTLSATVDAAGARAGNPLRLTVRVRGQGNIKLLPRPRLAVPWASVVAGAERVDLSRDSVVIGGTKSFEWLVTPRRAGQLELPAIRYPYFDPVAARYVVLTTPAETIAVAPGAVVAATDTSDAAPVRWPLRTRYRGALPPPLYHRSPFWLLVALVPLPALVTLARRTPRRGRAARPRSPTPAALLHALARGHGVADAITVRRAFTAALAQRLRLSPGALAHPAALEHAVRRAGGTRETAAAAAALLGELDVAAFGARREPAPDMAPRAERLVRAVDREAARLDRAPRSVALALLLPIALATSALTLLALPPIVPASPAARFAAGLAHYRGARYAAAAAEFAAVARTVPRAADAWANLGTAAWAASDTGTAVLGWQRAVRLEPLAARDARARLATLTAPAAGAPGALPPLAPVPLALVAALLWTAGWLLVARRPRRAPLLLAGALVLGAAGWAADRSLAARDLAVVVAPDTLHADPALAGEPRGTLGAGEIVRVVRAGPLWAAVTLDEARRGWVERSTLRSLASE